MIVKLPQNSSVNKLTFNSRGEKHLKVLQTNYAEKHVSCSCDKQTKETLKGQFTPKSKVFFGAVSTTLEHHLADFSKTRQRTSKQSRLSNSTKCKMKNMYF